MVEYKDYGANVRDFDIVKSGPVAFEIKYMSKESKIEYSAWSPRDCAAIIHQGVNSKLEVLGE